MRDFPFKYFEDITLSVIVPLYNEGAHVAANLALLEAEIAGYFRHYEILVISDGSTDETNEQICGAAGAKRRAFFFPSNRGKGAVLRHGFKEASGDFIFFIDGGMEIHPREIRTFVALMFLYQADIVVGSKRHPQSQVRYPIYRRVLSFIFQQLVRLGFNFNVTDTQVGIKMFRREVVREIGPWLKADSYAADLEILGVAARLGFRTMIEAPVRLDYFMRGKRSLLRDLFHTLRVGCLLLLDACRVWWRLRSVPRRQ